MSEMVFAYGSNMCSGRFRAYGMTPRGRGSAAVLDDYRLTFNKPSKDQSGKANVSPSTVHQVWGVLYEIDAAELAVLDLREGKGYARHNLTVRRIDGDTMEAWVYIAARPDTTNPLRPYTWYKRFLVEGAREHALPTAYIAELQAIDATIDADSNRHAEYSGLICAGPAE